MTTRTVHHLSRELEGALLHFPLPLCWDAEQIARDGPDYDVELWWLSWDQGAVSPLELVFAVQREAVSCRDCLEWLHA